MQAVSFSVILAYREREVDRLEACLRSLEAQTLPGGYEVILVDSGSTEPFASAVEQLCVQLGAPVRLAYAPTQGQPWNRSQTLNLGAALSQGDWLIFGDIDLIYPSDFLEKLAQTCRKGVKYNYRCRYLPEGEGRTDYALLAATHGEATLSRDTGLGLSILTKADFDAVGGFDERFLIWGVEDIALQYRVQKAGIETAWVPAEELVTFHIWHPHAHSQLPKNWYTALWNWYEESRDLPAARFASWTSLAGRSLAKDRSQFTGKNIVLNDDVIAHTHSFLHALQAAQPGTGLLLHADRPRLQPHGLVERLNGWLEKTKFGYRLSAAQYAKGLWEPEERYRSTMLHCILYYRHLMQDFYLEETEQHLRLYVYKA